MFREKLTNLKEKRGYLYIRESIYQRDKRTLKRKPSRLCDGSATKERGKYSKKIDIYCGKIIEVEVEKLETFKEYIEKILNKDYLEFKLNSKFEEIIDVFTHYLMYICDLNKEEFYEGKKKVYAIGDGYLSKDTIAWLKRFNIKGDYENSKEMERFTYRCEDCCIFDEDIINTLYLKLIPDISKKDLSDEIEDIKETGVKSSYDSYRDFIKKSR